MTHQGLILQHLDLDVFMVNKRQEKCLAYCVMRGFSQGDPQNNNSLLVN